MNHKLMGMLLAGALVVTVLPGTVGAADTFTDMPTDYSTASLQAAVENGLLGGNDGKIMPDANLTRAEMATILVRALGHADVADITAYEDVKSSDWFYDEIGHAVYMELFKGDGEAMRPNASITRQEAFVVLSRAFGLTAEDTSALAPFVDAGSVATWAQADVAAMVETGFVQGDGVHLNPLSNISRKDFAVVMDRMVETYITEAGTYSEVPAGSVVVNTPDVNLKDMDIDGFLVIGDGAWNGDISLSGVTADALIVRGGGVHTVTVADGSSFGRLHVAKAVGHVRFLVDDTASLGDVTVPDNKVEVIFDGNVSNLEVAANSTVYVRNGAVESINVIGENAKIVLEENASVASVTVQATASNAAVVVEEGGTVDKVTVAGEGAAVTGEGAVADVVVSGNDVKVETVGANVAVAEGTTGTTVGDEVVEGGTTTTVPEATLPPVIAGGGSIGGGDSTTTAFTATDINLTANVGGETITTDGNHVITLCGKSGAITAGKMTATTNCDAEYVSGTSSFPVGADVSILDFITGGSVDSAATTVTVEQVETLVANLYANQDIIAAQSKVNFTIEKIQNDDGFDEYYEVVVTGSLNPTSASYTGSQSYNLRLWCNIQF